jgi:hypothetical protein
MIRPVLFVLLSELPALAQRTIPADPPLRSFVETVEGDSSRAVVPIPMATPAGRCRAPDGRTFDVAAPAPIPAPLDPPVVLLKGYQLRTLTKACPVRPSTSPFGRLALAAAEWGQAQVDTIRLRLLKVAERVRVTARRIWVSCSSAYAWRAKFEAAYAALRC